MRRELWQRFSLSGHVIAITGGAGLLGRQHAEAIAEAGGIPVLLDINAKEVETSATELAEMYEIPVLGLVCDITDKTQIEAALETILDRLGRFDALVNNAANDPKMDAGANINCLTRFENLTLSRWHSDIGVGLTGAFLCAQVFGHYLATHGGGAILNVASDLAIIAPDQRIYRRPGVPPEAQSVKPVTYSVVKAGLVGLTNYLATYWAEQGVRVNAVSPGGVFNGQSADFVASLENLIPMGRMANKDEYKATIVYLLSEASSYVTGTNIVVDGGRTCW